MFTFAREPAPEEASSAMPMSLRVSVGVMCAAIIVLGLLSDAIIRVLLDATQSLDFGSV
jgi:hypothetical protein